MGQLLSQVAKRNNAEVHLFKCSKCPKRFLWQQERNAHEKDHEIQEQKRPTKPEKPEKHKKYKITAKKSRKSHKCSKCLRTFKLVGNRDKHETFCEYRSKNEQKNQPEIEFRVEFGNSSISLKTLHKCTKCEKSFESENDLNEHSCQKKSEKYKESFKCKFCLKEFRIFGSLVKHENYHKCNGYQCTKTFFSIKERTNHVKICGKNISHMVPKKVVDQEEKEMDEEMEIDQELVIVTDDEETDQEIVHEKKTDKLNQNVHENTMTHGGSKTVHEGIDMIVPDFVPENLRKRVNFGKEKNVHEGMIDVGDQNVDDFVHEELIIPDIVQELSDSPEESFNQSGKDDKNVHESIPQQKQNVYQDVSTPSITEESDLIFSENTKDSVELTDKNVHEELIIPEIVLENPPASTSKHKISFMKNSNSYRWSCQFCDKRFKKIKERNVHEETHKVEKKKIDQEVKNIVTNIVHEKASDKKDKSGHESMFDQLEGNVHIKILDETKNYVHITINRKNVHERVGSSAFNCQFCCISFDEYKDKIVHESISCPKKGQARNPDKQSNPFKCRFCPEDFDCSKKRTVHERIHKEKVVYESDTVKIRNVHEKKLMPMEKFQCLHCPKIVFPDLQSRKLHMETRHNTSKTVHERIQTEKCFECQFCKIKFDSVQRRNFHEKNTHKEKFQCLYCPRIFSDFQSRKLHEETHQHTSKTIFGCTKCGKSFDTEAQKKVHEYVHAKSVEIL